ncbi:MAG: hypothetical protein OK441_05480 [Thaumarchaeota archaeon]|nr:hypothetical protein [Nitrososphaerota archaeon]
MHHSARILLTGLVLLLGSITLDLAGSALQSLLVLVLSFALGIAGALVSIRGLIEFLGERV